MHRYDQIYDAKWHICFGISADVRLRFTLQRRTRRGMFIEKDPEIHQGSAFRVSLAQVLSEAIEKYPAAFKDTMAFLDTDADS